MKAKNGVRLVQNAQSLKLTHLPALESP